MVKAAAIAQCGYSRVSGVSQWPAWGGGDDREGEQTESGLPEMSGECWVCLCLHHDPHPGQGVDPEGPQVSGSPRDKVPVGQER
jgi:hypothetical protein